MLLWIGFAVLAVAVTGALALPFRRARTGALDGAKASAAIYRDQLAEIDADRARGLISEEDAKSARIEIARRLLAVSDAAAVDRAPATTVTAPARSMQAALAAIPLASVALYLALGAPSLPGRPFAAGATVDTANASVAELVGSVEARLRERPDDGRGWDVIAPVYLRLGRSADAAHAFSQSIRLNGESVRRLMGYAEATMLAGNGIVSEEVRRAANRILELEPARTEVKAWLALAKEQDGDLAGAAAGYRAMLAGAAAGAPWRDAVSERLAVVEDRIAGRPQKTPEAPEPEAPAAEAKSGGIAPSAGDMAAVQNLPPAEQAKMIEGMVARLAERLKKDGSDRGGWLKLVHAYQVLGRKSEAATALAEARKQFPADTAWQTELDELSKSLGLGS